jgi:phosphoserine phosphatase RsbU/P
VEAASDKDFGGPAMGLIPDAKFKTSEAKLAAGDLLLFFTDGVIEVENMGGSQFGIEGLQQSIRSNLGQPTESLLEAVISDVYKFAETTALADDACLVVAEL